MLTHFFARIFVIDFEFIADPGERPSPVCLVYHEIISGEAKRIWLEGDDQLSMNPPYSMGEQDLFVGYYSSAEWGCHLNLNWPLPINVVDLYSEFRLITNGLPGISKGLLGACQRFGVNAISESEKGTFRDRILQGPPYTAEDKENILIYCASDVQVTAELFRKMLPFIDIPRALFRGQYMKSIAFMEHYGIPVDVENLQRLKANWIPIQERLIQDIDKDYGVYQDTTFKVSKFEQYLSANGISWPRTEKGNLELKDDIFKDMVNSYPQLQGLKDLRYILGQLRLSDIPIGSDGRNRCLLSPFGTKTGRNAQALLSLCLGLQYGLEALLNPKKARCWLTLTILNKNFL